MGSTRFRCRRCWRSCSSPAGTSSRAGWGRACRRLVWPWSRQSAVGAVSLVLSLFQTWAPWPARGFFHRVCTVGFHHRRLPVFDHGDARGRGRGRRALPLHRPRVRADLRALFFAEWPNALALLGAGVVVATGIYTILRERAVAARLRAHARAEHPDGRLRAANRPAMAGPGAVDTPFDSPYTARHLAGVPRCIARAVNTDL
jgi:hypothetical protein